MAINNVIGIKNTIPWYLPADMLWFKYHTLNKPIIMGRRTFKSIGRPLFGRKNIVLSYDIINDQRVIWAKTPAQALTAASGTAEIMIIGGSEIYKIFLPKAIRLYLTHIDIEVYGDTWFPRYKLSEWYSTYREFHSADEVNIYDFSFEILIRS